MGAIGVAPGVTPGVAPGGFDAHLVERVRVAIDSAQGPRLVQARLLQRPCIDAAAFLVKVSYAEVPWRPFFFTISLQCTKRKVYYNVF